MSTWDILQIFLILAVMSAIMYGLLYLVKKYIYSYDKTGASDSRISVLSTQAVLPKKFVSVIKFNDKIYLLGISDQSVNLIDKLDSDSFDISEGEKNEQTKKSFLQLLKSNMGIK